jgi:hypothetical protein
MCEQAVEGSVLRVSIDREARDGEEGKSSEGAHGWGDF